MDKGQGDVVNGNDFLSVTDDKSSSGEEAAARAFDAMAKVVHSRNQEVRGIVD